jgi:hypothetical protein
MTDQDQDIDAVDQQRYRSNQLRQLPAQSGVYALCDLDCVPIYVGKSLRSKAEGINTTPRGNRAALAHDGGWLGCMERFFVTRGRQKMGHTKTLSDLSRERGYAAEQWLDGGQSAAILEERHLYPTRPLG